MHRPLRRSIFIVTTFVAVPLLVACANVDKVAEPREEKEYVTGSNIGRKDRQAGVATMSREDFERAKSQAAPPNK